jgi:hypothetical protein
LESLHARRLKNWRQTPATRITGPDDAVQLIERLGLVTLYPASPEVPNLYHAYVGDPERKTEAQWDSPAGQVFGWRWSLGRKSIAFYTTLVRKRSTWVRWDLLPAVLRLWGELRTLDELEDMHAVSSDGLRIARALEAADGTLSTGELRRAAGFSEGREQRSAYLKAVEELESRLLLAKVLAPEDDDMRHTLVAVTYAEHVRAADRLPREAALDEVLAAYVPCAAYALPVPLARHLHVPEVELQVGLNRLATSGRAATIELTGHKGACYMWSGSPSVG